MPTATKSTKTIKKMPTKAPVESKILTQSKALTKSKSVAKTLPNPDIGKQVPSFSLPATKIGKASNSTLKGKPYILYFYPKDDTSGCTKEACDFRDRLPLFSKLGVSVFGVSKDNLESHEKFAKKYALTFPLISDPECTLCAKLGVWKEKSMYGRKYMGIERSTFLIDGKGIIRASWRKVNVPGHVDELKKALADL